MANVLLFIDSNALTIGTVSDHLRLLRRFSAHDIHVVECRSMAHARIPLDRFDVVVFHYSVAIARRDFVSAELIARCAAFRGLKVLLIQDEYRWINATVKTAADLGIDVIFSVVNRELFDVVYGDPSLARVRKELTLTGFVPEQLLAHSVAPFAERPVDVGYRGRSVPFWLGAFAQEKWRIGERFTRDASAHGLTVDIAFDEKSRLYHKDWVRFLSRCKAVLGTESGASVLDFTGDIQRRVDAYVTERPGVSFEEVQIRILKDEDGKHLIHVISPRCFEAAALRTLMIHYPGEYSGAMEAWRHYVPLAKDHSNMGEVVAVLRSPERAQRIIDQAYHEVACNDLWSYRRFAAHFDTVVMDELKKRGTAAAAKSLRIGERYLILWEFWPYMAKFRLRRKLLAWGKDFQPYVPDVLYRLVRNIAVRLGLA